MKKAVKQFIISTIIIYVLIFIALFVKLININIVIASVVAWFINSMNFVASIWMFNKGFRKPNKEFLIYTLGGMGIRLFFMLILIFISIQFLNIDKYGFIFTLVLIYFINLIIEVNYFRKKVSEKQ